MTTQSSRYGSRLAPALRMLIKGFVVEGVSAGAIHQTLQALQRQVLVGSRLPDLRTIQRIVREVPAREPLEEPATASPEDMRVAWDAIADLLDTGTMPSWPSKALQHEMARLVPLTPGLAQVSWWLLAQAYVTRRAADETTDDLDAWIAFRPWESEGQCLSYAIAAWTTRVPMSAELSPTQYNEPGQEESILDPFIGVVPVQLSGVPSGERLNLGRREGASDEQES